MREFHNESLFPSQKHGIYILHVESELIPIYVNGYIIFYIENTCACKQITNDFEIMRQRFYCKAYLHAL